MRTDPSSSAAFEASLAEARARRNVKLFNSLMSRHARFGELDRVQAAFDAMSGLQPPLQPNEFTYGILLNAYTRCGALERCTPLVEEMRRTGTPVTAVAFTTLVKGCVNELDIVGAWSHFDALLAEPGQSPNIRTINTMLRGCLYVGDLAGTERLIELAARYGLEADQATRDSAVRAACQAFSAKKLQQALAAHGSTVSIGDATAGGGSGAVALSPAAQVDVAIAHALCGKFERAARALTHLEAATAAASVTAAPTTAAHRSGGGGSGEGAAAPAKEASAAREASMLRDSVANVQAFLGRPDRATVAREFTTSAVRRYPPVTYDSSGGERASESAPVAAWRELFGGEMDKVEEESTGATAAVLRPIKLEVGAGTGDWVVGRAQAERAQSHWAAIELRCLATHPSNPHSTQHTAHSTQHTAHSTQHTAHRTPHAALNAPLASHDCHRQVRPCLPDPREGGDARPPNFGPRRPRRRCARDCPREAPGGRRL